ncbi:MAG: LysM peptidoglycan-binding domain-containing protein [Aliishimia sp.]
MSAAAASSIPFWVGGLAIGVAAIGGGIWYVNQPVLPVDSLTPVVQTVAPDVPEAPPKPVENVVAEPEVVIEQSYVEPKPDPKPSISELEAEPEIAARPEPELKPVPGLEPAPEPELASEPEPEPEIEVVVATPPTPEPPRLDEVRLDQEGIAVIAGRATPFSEVILRANGAEVARTAADGRGAFATIAMLEPSLDARLLTLSELDDSGAEMPSPDELILAPIRAAAPEPAPEPAPLPEIATIDPQATDAPVVDTVTAATSPETPTAPEIGPAVQADLAAQPDVPNVPAATAGKLPGAQDVPTILASNDVDGKIVGQQKVAILRSGPEGVNVEQPLAPTPDVMSSVALDSISYSATGEVQLSGRAQSEAREIIVYLDNRPVAALQVDDDGGWRGDIPDIDSGIYTLRVDELTAEGKVTSRVETPFKRESPDVLFVAVDDTKLPVQAITVQAGTTLWAIARERYGDGTLFVQVFEANRDEIRDPNLIYPGQVFTLPEE